MPARTLPGCWWTICCLAVDGFGIVGCGPVVIIQEMLRFQSTNLNQVLGSIPIFFVSELPGGSWGFLQGTSLGIFPWDF